MIYTLTLNPAVDYIVTIKDFTVGQVNHIAEEKILPGGKGINVSIVLHNLGIDNIILGFAAGFTGIEIKRRLSEMNCREELILLQEGYSRINLKLCSNEESELNGKGPIVSAAAMRALYRQLDNLKNGDTLVLAGSIPASLPDTTYASILEYIEGRGVLAVVDAAKTSLKNTLPYRPFLLKPNHHELSEILQTPLYSKADVIAGARTLQQRGARNVLVSMGEQGAVLLTETGGVYIGSAPKGKVIHSVGSGDSMVAGFLYGYLTSGDFQTAFQTSIAAGSASAFSEHLASRAEINALYPLPAA